MNARARVQGGIVLEHKTQYGALAVLAVLVVLAGCVGYYYYPSYGITSPAYLTVFA